MASQLVNQPIRAAIRIDAYCQKVGENRSESDIRCIRTIKNLGALVALASVTSSIKGQDGGME